TPETYCLGTGPFIRYSEGQDPLEPFKKASSLKAMSLRRYDRISKKATYAMEAAITAASEMLGNMERNRIGLVLGTGLGTLETSLSCLDKIFEHGDRYCSPMSFMNSVHNSIAANLSQTFDLQGPNLTLSAGSLSFEQAFAQGSMLLKCGQADIVIVGAVEESSATLEAAREKCTEDNIDCSGFAGPPQESVCFIVLSLAKYESSPSNHDSPLSPLSLKCHFSHTGKEFNQLQWDTVTSQLSHDDLQKSEEMLTFKFLDQRPIDRSSTMSKSITPVSTSLLFMEARQKIIQGEIDSSLLLSYDAITSQHSLLHLQKN
ncbi:MAG: beta-ketoacyl synthase chain length factor, partial [Planctomycetes bacterium]|nr:beta-ketoacyl synthase chain length factor [Planctomycetota bacterium]